MDPDLSYLMLFGLISSIVLPFHMGYLIKRYEQYIGGFYWALVEYCPRSYVEPNRVIKCIRRICRLETKRKLHWLICICHYLQIVSASSPVIMIVNLFFLPLEHAVILLLVISVFPIAFEVLSVRVFLEFYQSCRCEKIKKKDPRYATHEFGPY